MESFLGYKMKTDQGYQEEENIWKPHYKRDWQKAAFADTHGHRLHAIINKKEKKGEQSSELPPNAFNRTGH